MGKINWLIFVFLGSFPFSFTSAFDFDDPCLVGPKEDPNSFYYNIPVRNYKVYQSIVDKNQVLGSIFQDCSVDGKMANRMIQKCEKIFDYKSIRPGKSFITMADPYTDLPVFMIYEPSKTEFVIFDFRNDGEVLLHRKALTYMERATAGEISGSLYESLENLQVSPKIAVELADVYAWTVDFFKIKNGDKFKVIFEEVYADGVFVETGKIKAASFTQNGEEIFSYFFQAEEQSKGGYYDQEGNTLKRAFLKAPVKFSHISSRYNKRRFHPVLRRVKAHLGTDYAAPHGTPIMSTADGVVIEAARNGGNGNYVKIKHNKTYTTQYLHMSKFAKGMRRGKSVEQGEVIGYVGSTGLATGPHVCYRFWKNGVQVDPLKEKITISEPLEKKHLPAFKAYIEQYKSQLNGLEYKQAPVQETSPEELEIS